MQYFVLFLTVLAVIIMAKFLSWPFKNILKLIFNILVGLIMILLVNCFGAKIGIHINFNVVTAIVSGILGIPGVICLIILNYIF